MWRPPGTGHIQVTSLGAPKVTLAQRAAAASNSDFEVSIRDDDILSN